MENKWGLDHGTLEGLNPGVDPKKLKIGQSIVANTDLPVNEAFTVSETKTVMETGYMEQPVSRSYAGVLTFAGVASVSDGPIPAGEVIGGLAIAGFFLYDVLTPNPTISIPYSFPTTTTTNNPAPFHYVTYTKVNSAGQVYVGRTSGYGDPASIVARRDANHHITGFGPAVVSTFAPATLPGGYATRALDPSYWAIRGSEQLQIEQYRKLGISANSINGISPNNPNVSKYIQEALKQFR